MSESGEKEKKSRIPALSKKNTVVVLTVILVIVFFAAAVFYYIKYQESLKSIAGGKEQEAKNLIAIVSKIAELPSETPTIATVSDVSALKDQKFFAKAKNGDKLLVYANAQKAYLYRPSTNKIIEIGPIVQNQNPSGAPTSGEALGAKTTPTQAPVRVFLLNGTTTTGLTKTAESTLKSKGIEVEIVDRDNAKKQDYEGSTVIDISGKSKEIASKIAAALGAQVGSLPDGEDKPADSDIIIILGSDFSK